MDSRRLWCLVCFAFLLAVFPAIVYADNSFAVSSPDFLQGRPIPIKFGYHQQNISPELKIENVPANAKSLVLIVDDPDAPMGLWTHWLVWNLPTSTTSIPEGKLPPNAVQGKNSYGNFRYDGPAPPLGTHRYFFRVYALDTTLSLPPGSARSALEQAMNGHILQETETFGTYRMALTSMP
jgi:Raf kinase inhibitor-like YbhB/YbcL family protein